MFASRKHHELSTALEVARAQLLERNGIITRQEDEIARLRGDVERLTTLLTSMQREGFRPTVAVVEAVIPRRDLPEEVQAAIDRQARPRSDEWHRLTEHAWELLEGNVDEGEIVRRIRYGRAAADLDDED